MMEHVMNLSSGFRLNLKDFFFFGFQRLIFKVDMYEFRGSAYEGMHSSSLVYLNLFDGGRSCE